MGPRGEWGLVAKDHYVDVTAPIQPLELALDPLILRVVSGDVGIQGQHERISIAKRVSRVARQATRRSLRWNERRHGIEIISHAPRHHGRFMVSRHEKVWYAAFGRQAIDERHEAYIPLAQVGAGGDGIA